MSCKCEKCGKPTNDCEFTLCSQCFLESRETDIEKDMFTMGRFYTEKLITENPVGGVEE